MEIIQDLARARRIKIYLVGGFLRNYFLGRSVKRNEVLDFDFAVSRDALKVARLFARRIKGAFVLLDQGRGCARVVKKERPGTLIFDFADFRARTLRGDLAHRDFTINALCVDIQDLGKITDLFKILLNFKRSARDLKAKTIRMVSRRSFKEDPLRLMRAFSLKAAFDLTIEPKTLKRIKQDRDLLKSVSSERVRDELFKILATSRAAENLKAMDRIGLLSVVIPQIRVMYDVPQGGYHHLDVWPHSLETVHQLEKVFLKLKGPEDLWAYLNEKLGGDHPRFALMKLAALLHDIGKPETKKQEKDRMSFHGHEHVGKSIVRHVARMLKISRRECYCLEDMVRWHLRPGYLSDFKNPSERSIFRYFRDTKEEAVGILLLSLADQRSTRGPLTSEEDQRHHERIVMRLIDKYFKEKRKKPFVRLINGHDLINELKLMPSPLFAKILKAVEEKQVVGEIETREEALEFARGIVER